MLRLNGPRMQSMPRWRRQPSAAPRRAPAPRVEAEADRPADAVHAPLAQPVFRRAQQGSRDRRVVYRLEEAEEARPLAVLLVVAAVDLGADAAQNLAVSPR